jgi:hypothetical protein
MSIIKTKITFWGIKRWPAGKGDNLTAICESIAQKMYDPQHPITPGLHGLLWGYRLAVMSSYRIKCYFNLQLFVMAMLLFPGRNRSMKDEIDCVSNNVT